MPRDRLRALNVPRRVTVELDAAGRPATAGGRPVESLGELWRIDDEWWRQPIARRYHDAVLAGGGRVMLYQDLISGAWFEQQP